MQIHRVEVVLSDDGILNLRDLPFHRGEAVQVIIASTDMNSNPTKSYPLRGLPVTLIEPTEPVAESEWEATA